MLQRRWKSEFSIWNYSFNSLGVPSSYDTRKSSECSWLWQPLIIVKKSLRHIWKCTSAWNTMELTHFCLVSLSVAVIFFELLPPDNDDYIFSLICQSSICQSIMDSICFTHWFSIITWHTPALYLIGQFWKNPILQNHL